MSLWQDFKDSLYEKVTGGDGFQASDAIRLTKPLLGGDLGTGAGSALSVYKAIEPFRGAAEEAVKASPNPFVARAGEIYGTLQEKALESVALPYRYAVARPLTTAMMGLDVGASNVLGREQQARLTGSSFGELGNLWNASEYVSPGQEIVAGFNSYIGDKNNGSSTREQVNLAIEKREKLRNFENNWAANIVSGGSDLVFNFALDPLVGAGKAAKATKFAAYNQNIAKETQQITEKTGGAWETIKWLTETKDAVTINNFFRGSNPSLARAFAQSTNEEETALIWMASRGNVEAINKLRLTSEATTQEIIANRSMLVYGSLSGYPLAPSFKEGLAREYEELLVRDKFLANALEVERTNVMVRKAKGQDLSIGLAAKTERQQRVLANAEAKTRAQFGVNEDIVPKTFYVGDGARRVTIWGGKTRQAATAAYDQGSATGVFHLQGANSSDGVVELQANLRSGPLRELFTGEEAFRFSNDYLNAANTADQNLILQAVEKEGVAKLAEKYGVTDQAVIDRVKNYIVDTKNGQVKDVVRDKQATWIDEAGDINIAPFLETQTPDTYVMLNWAEVDKVMRNVSKGLDESSMNFKETANWLYDSFNSIWKPAVLFRLGYPVRNISEGWFRSTAVTNAIVASQQIIPGVGNFAKNRMRGYIAKQFGKDIDDKTKELIEELQGHIAARLEIRGLDSSAIARGEELDLASARSLDDIMDQMDLVHANRQAVIENLLKEGKYRIGSGYKTYDGFVYEDSFAGVGGRYLRELSSSETSTQATIRSANVRTSGLVSGQTRAKVPTRVDPNNDNYAVALSDVVNTQFRNSYLYKRLIAGESEESVARWLSNSTDNEAAYVRKELRLKTGQNTRQVVRTVSENIERYLPDAELRANAALRDITPAEIENAMSKTGFIKVTDKQIKEAQAILGDPKLEGRLQQIKTQLDSYYSRPTGYQNVQELNPKVDAVASTIKNYEQELKIIRAFRNTEKYSSLTKAQQDARLLREQKVKQLIASNRERVKKLEEEVRVNQQPGQTASFKLTGKKVRKLEAEYDRIIEVRNKASVIVGKPLKSAESELYTKQRELASAKAEAGVVKNNSGEFVVVTFKDGQRVERTFADEKRANAWFRKNQPPAGYGQPIKPEAQRGMETLGGPGTKYVESYAPVQRMDSEALTTGGAAPSGRNDWTLVTGRNPDGTEYQIATKGGEWQRWQPIHGKEIMETVKAPNIQGALRRGTDKVFKYIGSLPEDTLLRHPFVNMRYNQYMRQGFDDLTAQGVNDISNAELQAMSRAARAYSLREVKRTLYTIERYSRGAETMRFISPFFAAYENTARTWGRIMLNDPSVAARFYQVLTAPVRAGWVVDQDGIPVDFQGARFSPEWSLQLQVPTGVADKIPGLKGHETMRFNLKSMNVVFQGENIFTPGVGPLVQIPVSEAIKIDDNKATRFLAEYTLTTGVSRTTGSVDLVTPAWMRRAFSLYRADNAADYSRDFAMLYQQRRFELQQQGVQPPNDLLERVKEETDRFYAMRTVANLVLPASPQFGIKPEYQQYIDKWRQYQQQGTIEGVTAAERYRKDFPEYFAFGFSTSQNATGVTATKSARQNAERYDSTISSVLSIPGVDPGVLGAIINNPDDTSYDQYTAAWQTNRQVTPGIDVDYRSNRSPKEAADQPYIAQGWDQYIAMSNKVQAILTSKGLKSLSSRGAEGLQAYRRDWLAWAAENNPAWFVSYSQRDDNKFNANAQAFSRALEDPKFSRDKQGDAAWQTIGSYLKTREKLKQTLLSRQANGGSSLLTSESNSDLAAFYTDYVSWINEQSPRASELFTRYFEGEFGRIEQLTQQQQVGVA